MRVSEQEIVEALAIIEEECGYSPDFMFIIKTFTSIVFMDAEGYAGFEYNVITKEADYLFNYSDNISLLERAVPEYDKRILQGFMHAG